MRSTQNKHSNKILPNIIINLKNIYEIITSHTHTHSHILEITFTYSHTEQTYYTWKPTHSYVEINTPFHNWMFRFHTECVGFHTVCFRVYKVVFCFPEYMCWFTQEVCWFPYDVFYFNKPKITTVRTNTYFLGIKSATGRTYSQQQLSSLFV